MTNQAPWFAIDESNYDPVTAKLNVAGRELMAITKKEYLEAQSKEFKRTLSCCDWLRWPFSSYYRWKARKDNQRMIKTIEKYTSDNLDTEMDKITAQLKENMNNIDTIQRGKCGNK